MKRGDILVYKDRLYRVIDIYEFGIWSPYGIVPLKVEDYAGRRLSVSNQAVSAFTRLKLNNGKG